MCCTKVSVFFCAAPKCIALSRILWFYQSLPSTLNQQPVITSCYLSHAGLNICLISIHSVVEHTVNNRNTLSTLKLHSLSRPKLKPLDVCHHLHFTQSHISSQIEVFRIFFDLSSESWYPTLLFPARARMLQRWGVNCWKAATCTTAS